MCLLMITYYFLSIAGYFKRVKSEFSAKVPCVNFMASDQNIRCQVAVSNALSVKTSELLAVYANLDPRVKSLVVLFKYWAKVGTILQVTENVLLCRNLFNSGYLTLKFCFLFHYSCVE